MTHTEIFQNMDKSKRLIEIEYGVPKQIAANAYAENIAVNETWLKGINPESVEKIYSKALNLVHAVSDNIITSSSNPFVYMVDVRKELMELKEALTAAKKL